MNEQSTRLRRLLEDVLGGEIAAENLKLRKGDCRVLRASRGSGSPSVIFKLWRRTGVSGLLRKLSRTSPMHREARALDRLKASGIAVPKVLGTFSIRSAKSEFTHALALEDLGPCTRAVEHIGTLLRNGDVPRLDGYVAAVIELTEQMLNAGVVDTDHSLVNIVATPDGRAARLDLEIARCYGPGRLPEKEVGQMLGRLVATYTFAVQPRTERVTEFARQLVVRMDVSPNCLSAAAEQIHSMLDEQRRNGGPDSRVELPWGLVR